MGRDAASNAQRVLDGNAAEAFLPHNPANQDGTRKKIPQTESQKDKDLMRKVTNVLEKALVNNNDVQNRGLARSRTNEDKAGRLVSQNGDAIEKVLSEPFRIPLKNSNAVNTRSRKRLQPIEAGNELAIVPYIPITEAPIQEITNGLLEEPLTQNDVALGRARKRSQLIDVGSEMAIVPYIPKDPFKAPKPIHAIPPYFKVAPSGDREVERQKIALALENAKLQAEMLGIPFTHDTRRNIWNRSSARNGW